MTSVANREEEPAWSFFHSCCGFHGHFPKCSFVLFSALFFWEDSVGGTLSSQSGRICALKDVTPHPPVSGA